MATRKVITWPKGWEHFLTDVRGRPILRMITTVMIEVSRKDYENKKKYSLMPNVITWLLLMYKITMVGMHTQRWYIFLRLLAQML